MTLYPQLIIDALATVTYAGTKKSLVESGMLADTPSVAAPSAKGQPWKVKVVLVFPRDTDPFLKSTVRPPKPPSITTAVRRSRSR